MGGYVLSIAGAVLISAVFTLVSPGGKMGKFVRGAMKLFTVVILVSPFVAWFGSGNFPFKAEKIGEDAGYYAAVKARLEDADEGEIALLLKEEFGAEAEVTVVRSASPTFSREKIVIKISAPVISPQGAHKDITDRVQALLEEKYGCPTEVT